ncbi:putative mitogen activated protein kinase 7 [Monocercomonoides exilis]|uniref:putative mitogen activated protein kinase 7 n=1 Tax=Monocercomonoides exilis TaxID=2049356 RepID=UPI0035595971|nr:putative mitogen activated protein kinase 7 [Monocercomonoides exilis]|eukprot:MONOS_4848.1-p1 / transcript=MONOS_4848.1 / gene=MONOS_4848 / organism=Monocercomonoides_exilis_PA203 / gene_product=mitogen activated protein kinase 7 / transcript_product=mitogen activated protein kinase 7 / location=Mono_scaffold00135:35826-37097(-) / protein_length=355 / sequence_SO=supercontig / SO=protein_coding / is_pseudo=false
MEKYRYTKQLGDGTYGSVAKAVNTETLEIVAVKEMKQRYKSWRQCIELREVQALLQLHHPNVVGLKEVVRQGQTLFFVFEHMDDNLYQIMAGRETPLPETKIRNMIYQLLQGLAYMHRNNFFHRDIKPENLLVSGDTLKIADLGLAREIDSTPPYTDYVSTRWYRAPEVLLRSGCYNAPVDLWAVGCIMAELYSLEPLFPGDTEVDELSKIFEVLGTPTQDSWPLGVSLIQKAGLKFPVQEKVPLFALLPSANSDAVDLMERLLFLDPSKRPTAAEALRHPFFTVSVYRSVRPSSDVTTSTDVAHLQDSLLTDNVTDRATTGKGERPPTAAAAEEEEEEYEEDGNEYDEEQPEKG